MSLDLVIRNGTLFDGTGKPPVQADIAVAGGRIAAIGRIDERGGTEIDAQGLNVAPGFIDIHSHSDYTLLRDPRAVSAVKQGVTLEVIGNCGFGCAPLRDPVLARNAIYGFDEGMPLAWRGVGEYLERLEKAKPAINVAMLVPNGQLRLAAIGIEDRPADAKELDQMAGLLADGLAEGAHGYSTGLEYPAERAAPESEITQLARVAARTDALYATHTRDRDHKAVEAIEEAVRTAEHAGVRLQVSHLLPRVTAGGMLERSIETVATARARGLDAAFDMHTRRYGTTFLNTILPPWATRDGREALRAHLDSAESRARMKGYPSIIAAGGWDRIVLLDNPTVPEFSRRTFGDVGRELGRDPHDVAFDVLMREIDHLHRPMVIILCYEEDAQAAIFSHPLCMPGSDATTLAPDGPLAGATFHGAYSWAAWFWRFTVKQRRVLSPEEAIHRLTALPASVMRLGDRGVLREGAAADIAVFDPDRFAERATTFEPNQLAEGMMHVVVNGSLALRDGRLTGERGGAVLRRRAPPRYF
ncbi:MAG: amidohydrolase family protein [Alphaproteobacteria bacterium]|nr:amidohydrolase family protein [Alphaproteobacteria bacterium]